MNSNINLQEIVKDYPFLAAGASFIQPGLGQILCVRIRRGIAFLFPRFILMLFFYLITILYELGLIPPLQNWYLIPLNTLSLAVRVISVYDAYRITKEPGKS